MSLTIDLTPTEEAQLDAIARQRGTNPAEFVRKWIKEQLPMATIHAPNEKALAALREIAEMKKGLPETDGSQTEQQIRAGRAGEMYGGEHGSYSTLPLAFAKVAGNSDAIYLHR